MKTAITHSMASRRGISYFAAGEMHSARRVLSVIKVYVNILKQHRAFVDENADRQRQPPEGHDVDRLTANPEKNHRCQKGKWNCDDNDQRRTPITQKEKKRQSSQ